MAGFDPDAYLAATAPKQSSGFDPDAYLAATDPQPAQQPMQAYNQPAQADKKLVLPEVKSKKASDVVDIPTNWQVARNAVAKGVAAVPDMVSNVIPNAVNLATAAGGYGLHELGLIDQPPDLPLENPDLYRKAGEAVGLINPKYNPQTKGQRYLDTGVQAATGALLTGGSGGIRNALANVAAGVAGGETAQFGAETGHPTAGLIGGAVVGGLTAGTINKATGATVDTVAQKQNSIKDANFQAAREAGIKIPASQSNPDSLLANAVDIVMGGRPRMQQAAALANQSKVTQAAARDLGLDPTAPISNEAVKGVITKALDEGYKPLENAGTVTVSPKYNTALDNLQADVLKAKKGFSAYDDGGLVKTIDSLRTNEFDAGSGVAMIRQLREDASSAYAKGDSKMGKALKGASKAIEDELENHLQQTGQQDLLKNYVEARKQIAKANTVEKSLNPVTGDVSAQKLGRLLDKGVPLSGEMRDIALASKLPGASLADTKYSTTGASQLEGLAALGGAAGTGNPLVLAVPLARGIGRKIALSDAYGKFAGTPSYNKFSVTPENRNALIANMGLAAERNADK